MGRPQQAQSAKIVVLATPDLQPTLPSDSRDQVPSLIDRRGKLIAGSDFPGRPGGQASKATSAQIAAHSPSEDTDIATNETILDSRASDSKGSACSSDGVPRSCGWMAEWLW